MTDFGSLKSDLKRIGFGLLFILVSMTLSWVQANRVSLIPTFCVANGKFDGYDIFCFMADAGTNEFGLKTVALSFLLLGIFLVFFFKFFVDLMGKAINFALGHSANAASVVLRGMEENRFSRSECSRICSEALARHRGYYDPYSKSISEFIVSRIFNQTERDGGFWRKNYISDIILQDPIPKIDLPVDKYYRWRESARYSLFNIKPPTRYAAMSSTSIEVSPDDLEMITKSISYKLRCDGRNIFDIRDHTNGINIDDLRNGTPYKKDGCEIAYSDGLLKVSILCSMEISQEEAQILYEEDSFILRSDCAYELYFYEPTEGFQLRLTLPYGLTIHHPAISCQRYGSTNLDRIHITDEAQRLSVDNPHWCLPGIVAMVTWKPMGDSSVPTDDVQIDGEVNGHLPQSH